MRRPSVLVGIGLVIVVTLTACSTGERVDLGNESSQNIIAAIAGEPDQLDPHKTSAYFSFEVLENVYDTLVEPDENLEMRPALAESWEVSGGPSICGKASRSMTAARSRLTTSCTPTNASSIKSSRTQTVSARSLM
jgi:ABC-type transport system substrate-binding protein